MSKPPSAFSVATVQLQSPFTDIAIFTDPQATAKHQLGFSWAQTPWVYVDVSVLVPITATDKDSKSTVVNFYWDEVNLGYVYSVNGVALTAPSSTSFKLLTTPPPSTSTSSGPTSPIGTATTDQSDQPNSSIRSTITQAPASPTPTPTSPPLPSSSPSTGLSGGAVAGVAIGCLLGGALIAGLLAWFFLRKKGPDSVRDSEASSMALIHREKGPTAKTMSLESGSPIAAALENGLPLPLEDKAITGEISKISNLIKNHVQSYYHAGRVSPVLIDYDDLQALGSDMPVSVGTLSTLLGNSATRESALRFCIAWIVVSRMQIDSPPNTTFLPPEISKCFQAMSLIDRGSRMHATYFAKWRAITAALMQSTYVRNPFSTTDARLYNLQAAADLLNNVLRPYGDLRMDDGQRSRNLEEILKRSALFAFTLFSQRSTWVFDWQNEQDVKSGSLCVFPALLQVKDENGEPIKPPRPFSEAVVRRLDE
ncbi:hypothetical protein K458DRAFT_387960 [Lentithecium fluviatile CBS 122367]|uniref:Uncharacterized protein n=1 Tax=Lentithecium fluviatile CBS 122367 TaxID=1168545 RepID=A0A6G1J3H3_9PLEO|nr:hypothetical protein K458DRAFT_387960 [Lentithecium fluviatile CBS 122367]